MYNMPYQSQKLLMEAKDKEWYVVTLFGKYATIVKDREKWEAMGYTYHEKEKEVLLSNGNHK